MNSEEDRSIGKISYEKPTAMDLGPTAPIVGASCAQGDGVKQGACGGVGNSASDGCGTGYGAG